MPVRGRQVASRTKRVAEEIANPTPDELLQAKVKFARRSLENRGVLSGALSKRLSARVDPGLVDEAKRRSGVQSDSELVSAALTLMAADDNFGAWLVSQKGRLPDDFELPI